jgi:hypothetical protein
MVNEIVILMASSALVVITIFCLAWLISWTIYGIKVLVFGEDDE